MERNSRRQSPDLKAGRDFGIAIVMVFFGCFIIFSRYMIGRDYFEESAFIRGGTKWVVGILFMLYGIFRAYRGYVAIKKGKENDY